MAKINLYVPEKIYYQEPTFYLIFNTLLVLVLHILYELNMNKLFSEKRKRKRNGFQASITKIF